MRIPTEPILRLIHAHYDDPTGTTPVSLDVVVEGRDINARDLISLLEVIDRAYGEASPRGLYSYGKTEDYQLTISDIRSNSPLTLILSVPFLMMAQLGAVWVVLRSVVKLLPEAGVNISLAYKQYWEGREVKQRVQQAASQDDELATLPPEERRQVVEFIKDFSDKYYYQLRRAIRLQDKHKLTVKLETKPPKHEDS